MMTISIFRAITGASEYKSGSQLYKGVTDRELIKNGVFASNSSEAQVNLPQPELGRQVSGLPVFLDKNDAVFWLQGKKYENAPALIEVKIPISEAGKIRIVKNSVDPSLDTEISLEEFDQDIAGKPIQGEFYLQTKTDDAIQMLHKNEVFYRAEIDSEGNLIDPQDFREINLKENDEGRSDLNLA